MATTRKPKPRKEETNGHCADGTMDVIVLGGEYDGQTITYDMMLLRLCSAKAMEKHQLTERGGLVEPTAEFAVDLCSRLKAIGYKATPAIAIHAWQRMCEYLEDVQKKTKRLQNSRTGTGSTPEPFPPSDD